MTSREYFWNILKTLLPLKSLDMYSVVNFICLGCNIILFIIVYGSSFINMVIMIKIRFYIYIVYFDYIVFF